MFFDSVDNSNDRDWTDQSLDTSKSNMKLQNTQFIFERFYKKNKEHEEKMRRKAKALNVKRDEVPYYFSVLVDDEELVEEEKVNFEVELKKTSNAIRKAEFDISRLNKIPI